MGISNINSPLSSDWVPVSDGFDTIFTFERGSPFSSAILPWMGFVWANKSDENETNNKTLNDLTFNIITSFTLKLFILTKEILMIFSFYILYSLNSTGLAYDQLILLP